MGSFPHLLHILTDSLSHHCCYRFPGFHFHPIHGSHIFLSNPVADPAVSCIAHRCSPMSFSCCSISLISSTYSHHASIDNGSSGLTRGASLARLMKCSLIFSRSDCAKAVFGFGFIDLLTTPEKL